MLSSLGLVDWLMFPFLLSLLARNVLLYPSLVWVTKSKNAVVWSHVLLYRFSVEILVCIVAPRNTIFILKYSKVCEISVNFWNSIYVRTVNLGIFSLKNRNAYIVFSVNYTSVFNHLV